MLTMNNKTLLALIYKVTTDADVLLRLGDWHNILVYRAMVEYKCLHSEQQSDDGTDLTQQEFFDKFMGSLIYIHLVMSSQAVATNPAAPNVAVSTTQLELHAFCKGI
jgi:hypothetical protein